MESAIIRDQLMEETMDKDLKQELLLLLAEVADLLKSHVSAEDEDELTWEYVVLQEVQTTLAQVAKEETNG
jgi:hypothetical protein